jgi:hypothetical protein
MANSFPVYQHWTTSRESAMLDHDRPAVKYHMP